MITPDNRATGSPGGRVSSRWWFSLLLQLQLGELRALTRRAWEYFTEITNTADTASPTITATTSTAAVATAAATTPAPASRSADTGAIDAVAKTAIKATGAGSAAAATTTASGVSGEDDDVRS